MEVPARKIAAQESRGGQQFLNNGYPLFSSAHDNGYGIYQLTNPKPTYNEVWNWKANIDSGIVLLNQKKNQADSWMTKQRRQAREETGEERPVDGERVGRNCFFSDNSNMTIEDAVAVQLFNGAPRGYYCAWDNSNQQWKFNRLNDIGENYVLLVCNQNV
jgi:hypothetical protein